MAAAYSIPFWTSNSRCCPARKSIDSILERKAGDRGSFSHDGRVVRVAARQKCSVHGRTIHTLELMMHPGSARRAEAKKNGSRVIRICPASGQNFRIHFCSGRACGEYVTPDLWAEHLCV